LSADADALAVTDRLDLLRMDMKAISDREALIVVAQSARALASSARDAGYAPLTIDLFGDLDTRAASVGTIVVEGAIDEGFDRRALARAIDSLIAAHRPLGLVYGSGFEREPDTIASFSEKIRVFGNDAATVARSKDPVELAALCRSLGVAHPEVATRPPAAAAGWLSKLRGGAGGSHIRPAGAEGDMEGGQYFQRRVEGEPVSALFLADGAAVELVGFSAQWTSPADGAPFRYGGAAGPAEIEPTAERAILSAIAGLTGALNLKGLNSADFLVAGEGVTLLELNPRPGATLDVFDRDDDPLIARHIAACEGRSASRARVCREVRAAEIVYAPEDIVVKADRDWPDFIADRSPSGTRIAAGGPLCTVVAEGVDVTSARALAAARAGHALAFFQGAKR